MKCLNRLVLYIAIAAGVFFFAFPGLCEDKKDAPLLYSKAVASYHDGNFVSAIDGFKQVVALSPNHPIAWNDLGRAYLGLNRNAQAIAAFQQQIKVNPNSVFAYNNLGLALEYEKRYEEAEDAFKRQLQFSPHDRWAHGNLARVALMRHEYELAARELQSVIEITPKDPNAYVSLAELYLQIGRPEKAIPEMDRAIELSATPHIWNNFAYLLAKHDLQLDRAQRYSESAVQSVEARLRTMEVRTLTRSDVDSVDTLAADWDTLGLIHFKRSHFATAEAYISAAWTLTQSGTAAFHLGQVYEAEKRLDDAKLMYACAQNSHEIVTDLRPLLNGLVSLQSEEQQLRVKCSARMEEARHITLSSSSKEKGEAKIIVGVGSDSTITGARWISGGLSLEAAKDALKSFDFSFVFPSPTPTQIFLVGNLSCTENCEFIYAPSGSESIVAELPLKHGSETAQVEVSPISRPVLVSQVSPKYPDDVRSSGMEGIVVIKINITVEGKVTDAKVISGPPRLTDSAIRAVRQWRFSPALLEGKAVPVQSIVNIRVGLGN